MGSQAILPGEAEPLDQPSPEAVDKAIAARAPRPGIDRNLVRAVIKVESNFNPHAVSPKGAMGLIELMPYTAKSLSLGNAFETAARRSRLENYNFNLELPLTARNAGAVNPSRGIPPYRETRDTEDHRYFSNNE